MDWFPEPYEDETLYSVLARLCTYLGGPNFASFSRALTGGRHWIALTQLPCQLDAIAEHFGLDSAAVDQLIDHHSLLPFYTAFAGDTLRQRARAAMRSSSDGLHFTLGMSTSPVPPPTHLRFCHACRAEMLECHGEPWWRRIHQLPGILVCAVHGLPLANSRIDLAEASRHELVAAGDATDGDESGSGRRWNCSPLGQQRLVELAQAARELLISPPEAANCIELYERRWRQLASAGMTRGTRQVQAERLENRLRDHWCDALETVSGLSMSGSKSASWPLDLVRNRRKLAHPLRHLVFNLALEAAETVEQPFGAGPWPCRNPIGGHFMQLRIACHREFRDKGKLHGHFSCDCGYSYSLTRQVDGRVGKPRFREFGPSLKPFLEEAIGRGQSLRATARAVALDPKTLLSEANRSGATVPWRAKPSRKLAARRMCKRG